MESVGDKVISRAQITDSFTDSTLIPDRYVGSDVARDGVVVGDDESYELPVVDMARLLDPEFSEAEIAKLGSACRDWGFFQLQNHGVDQTVVLDMKDNTMQFFGLPLEKRKQWPSKQVASKGLDTTTRIKLYSRHHCLHLNLIHVFFIH